MIDVHICDGDLVLVRRQDSAQPNDIVAAMVE
jgi:repressor LexA